MKHNRWLRSLVCLLVVCALIVNMVPARAKAVEPISTALGLGIVAAALLMSAGVVYSAQSPAELEALGQSMHTHMYQWGTSAEKLDEVDEFFGYLQLYQPDPEDPDPHKIKFGKGIALGLATWMCSLLRGDEKVDVEGEAVPEGYAYYNGILLPELQVSSRSPYQILFYNTSKSRYEFYLSREVWTGTSSYTTLAKGISVSQYYIVGGSWKVGETYFPSGISFSRSFYNLVYSNFDVLSSSGDVVFPGSDPVYVQSVEVEYDSLLGDIAPGIQEGTHDEEDIMIPDSLDFSDILTYGGLTGADAIGQLSSDLSSGALSYQDYLDMTDFEYTPPAKAPEININLNTEKVTYEQGAAARPLIINASSPDGGTLSYCWYQVNPNDFVDLVVEGAISPKFIPKTDEEGEYQYYCRVHNLVANGSDAYTDSQIATIEIVAPGTVTQPDVSTDPVTQTGLKGMLADIGAWLSGLLDAVLSIPQAILDGIVGLFVPSVDALVVQQNKWQQLLADRFGIMYEAGDLILGIGEEFSGITVKDTITLPTITLPLGEVDWTIGGWTVDVVPDGFEFLIDTLKLIINVLCTFAFIGAMRRRFDRVMEG